MFIYIHKISQVYIPFINVYAFIHRRRIIGIYSSIAIVPLA